MTGRYRRLYLPMYLTPGASIYIPSYYSEGPSGWMSRLYRAYNTAAAAKRFGLKGHAHERVFPIEVWSGDIRETRTLSQSESGAPLAQEMWITRYPDIPSQTGA